MSVTSRIASMLKRERAEEDFPPLAFEERDKLFLLEGAGKVPGYLGAFMLGYPVAGLDQTTIERLKGALSNDIPAGTFIQITLLATPDIDKELQAYIEARAFVDRSANPPEQNALLDRMIDDRVALFRRGRDEPLITMSGVKCNSAISMVSVKMPIKEALPSDKELKAGADLASRVEQSMSTFGLNLTRCGREEYIGKMRRIMHMHDEKVSSDVTDDAMLRDQILAPGDRVTMSTKGIRINDTHIGVLSIARLPKRANLGFMNYFIGDPRGSANQLTEPYMMTLTLHYPDQAAKATSVRRNAQVINYQAYGPMLRWVPKLAYKKRGYDIMVDTMEQGAVLVEMNFTLSLFARDSDSLSRLMSATRTYYSSFGLEIGEEKYISWPVFWNTLPLFPSEESIKLTSRFHTMAVKHAVNFAPILSEWRGTGAGAAMILQTRRGQPLLFDLYDSDTNYNALIFAEAGAGKSFLTQEMIKDYLSTGDKVWVIDIGKSYKKLCKALHGEFIEFSPESNICMNPFTEVVEIDEDVDTIKMLIAKMAAPQQGLDDTLYGRLEEAIKAVWTNNANATNITHLYEYLNSQDDPRLRDLAATLFSFTRHGTYGTWFDGDANLNFNSNFVVLELEELASRKTLQQVVLLQLIIKIQHEMFLDKRNGDNRRRIVIIDEAWELLSDGGVAKFLEAGYRKFRKYDGAAVIVTQGIMDLHNSPQGKAIAANSANMIIMQQRSETIQAARETGQLGLGDYGFSMLETISTIPRSHSEAMFYTGKSGWGIGRLAVDRFSQVLYSTKGGERYEVFDSMERGMEAIAAVENYIERHG